MSLLLEPLTLRSVVIRNRVGMAPMCQYMSPDGRLNDWHLVHLGSRAIGGVGLIILEATAVSPEGRVTPYDLGLWSDEFVTPLSRLTSFLSDRGAVPGIQLSHAGRKASRTRPWERDVALPPDDGGWTPIAPSPLSFANEYAIPREMTLVEIADTQQAFRDAASRARDAGFRFLELHGGHGRLLHNFYSPLSNDRTDRYGGDFDNRTRFLVETVRAVRRAWPEEYPLAVRLSCVDWAENGWTLDESIRLAMMLKQEGVDLIDCSSGGIRRPARARTFPGYQAPFAEAIRREAGVATAAVGLITNREHAEYVLAAGQADLVLLGRELLRNPHWVLDAARHFNFGVYPLCPPPYLKGLTYSEERQGHLAEL